MSQAQALTTTMAGVASRLTAMRMETARLRTIARERLDERACRRDHKEPFPRGGERRREYAEAIRANRYIERLLFADTVGDAMTALDEADTAFAVLNLCDGLTPQARGSLRKAWRMVQTALAVYKGRHSAYARAVELARREEAATGERRPATAT